LLFTDVAGSTELGEARDPEAVRAVMDQMFALARTVIERHGGLVEKFVGDTVMAAFGLPRSARTTPFARSARRTRSGGSSRH
jgi:class 3 adenylate cyclase